MRALSNLSLHGAKTIALRSGYALVIVALVGAIAAVIARGDQSQKLLWPTYTPPVRIVIQGPNEAPVQNLYLLDPAQPQQVSQITFSKTGINTFDVASDGQSIVFAEVQDAGNVSLSQLNLATGTTRLLYACPDALCTNPIESPDRSMIAFEQVSLNSAVKGITAGPPRVYILDTASGSVQRLFADNQRLAYGSRWSPDSRILAVFSFSAKGIVLHDVQTGNDRIIETLQGESGRFSPDGKWLLFPQSVELPNDHRATHFYLADLASPDLAQHPLIPNSDPSDDREALWSPDSRRVILLRMVASSDQEPTPQVVSLDIASEKVDPLIVDSNSTQSDLQSSPAGDELLLQRFPFKASSPVTEFWTYNFATHSLIDLHQQGFAARWVP